jgi:hypothetical protein
MPQLPQEIVDRIVFSLHQLDTITIRNCALVNRALRPQAQRLLFAHITLRSDMPRSLTHLAHVLVQHAALGYYVTSFDLWHSRHYNMDGGGIASNATRLVQIVNILGRIF